MCSRVIVIHKGKIRASDTAENLLRNHRAVGSVRLEIRGTAEDAREALGRLPGVKEVSEETHGD